MENSKQMMVLTLADVLQKVNEAWDDFSSCPAKSVNDRGAFEDFPLHKFAICGDLASARVLIDNGAVVNAIGEDGDTPLHRAVAARDIKMIVMLVSKGADPDIKNSYGNSPLSDAREARDPELIEALARSE